MSENLNSIMPISFDYYNYKVEGMDKHHIIAGSCRQESEKFGLFFWVTREQHERIHKNRELYLFYVKEAQRVAMEHYGWSIEEWRKHFRMDYRWVK